MLDQIETERMIGYRMQPSHFDDLNALHKDEEVAKTLGGVWSDNFLESRMQTYIDHWDEHGFGLWMFYDKKSGVFIGRGGLVETEIDGQKEVEVGFAVLSKHWRKGYAEEMGRKSMDIGFNILKRQTLVSFTLPINIASQNLIQKLGFSYEKEITYFELKQKLYRKKNSALI